MNVRLYRFAPADARACNHACMIYKGLFILPCPLHWLEWLVFVVQRKWRLWRVRPAARVCGPSTRGEGGGDGRLCGAQRTLGIGGYPHDTRPLWLTLRPERDLHTHTHTHTHKHTRTYTGMLTIISLPDTQCLRALGRAYVYMYRLDRMRISDIPRFACRVLMFVSLLFPVSHLLDHLVLCPQPRFAPTCPLHPYPVATQTVAVLASVAHHTLTQPRHVTDLNCLPGPVTDSVTTRQRRLWRQPAEAEGGAHRWSAHTDSQRDSYAWRTDGTSSSASHNPLLLQLPWSANVHR